MVCKVWLVVGGSDKGGVIVRSGEQTSSLEEPTRLSTGALIEELDRRSQRLQYRLLSGSGPFTGWVSTRIQTKELLAEWGELDAPRPLAAPAASGGASDAGPPSATADAAAAGCLSRLGFERVANVRDAAGADPEAPPMRCRGGRLRRGLLFRTGQWASATEADLAKLRDELGIRTYVDLRNGSGFEAVAAPCFDAYPPCPSGRHKGNPELAPGQSRRVHCSFTKDMLKNLSKKAREEDKGFSPLVTARRRACLEWYVQMSPMEENGLVHSLCCTMRYILFVNCDEVLRALRILADPANYPVAYGCTAGKDRTGIFGQLVLSALGVGDEDILADYLATNDSSAHIAACNKVAIGMYFEEVREKRPREYKMLVPESAEDGKDARQKGDDDSAATSEENLAGSRVYEEILRYTHHVLETECGGAVGYLESIGFGARDVAALRGVLVEPDTAAETPTPNL
mmetsp:Transcript_162099/g.519798  ORF Transcript_162099/g.519798 Transcript_162099/m.519798 type:complete len:457 (-) Transcript_162099:30-1400(-)